jgi:hypothetical protein
LDENKPLARLKRSAPATKCRRELRLSPAVIPVLCTRGAVFKLVGVDLCKEHLQEAMRVAETKRRPE